jgi:hypothetical protein
METLRILMAIVCIGLAMPQASAPAAPVDDGKAKVVDAYGSVQEQTADASKWSAVNVGDSLTTKTTLLTSENSAVLLQMPGNHMLRVGAGTKVVLNQLGADRAFSFNVIAGRVWSFVRRASKPTKYEIETPSAVVGVSGTVFSVFHNPQSTETYVTTNHGNVAVRQGDSAPIAVTDGNALSVRPNSISSARVVQQAPQTVRMWRVMTRTEGWMLPAGGRKINHSIDTIYRPFASGRRGPISRPGRQPKIRP